MAATPGKHTFITYNDIYKEADDPETGTKSVLICRNKKLEYDCYLEHIKSVTHVVNKEGQILKNKTRIFHEFEGPIIVKGMKQEISDIVFGVDNRKIGF
jgi:hypothetical protein